MKRTLYCDEPLRREIVRQKSALNGLDYLEVSEDQLSLAVYFLLKAPADLKKEHVVIKGGRRVTDIRVLGIEVCRDEDPERDDCLHVWVDKPGDFSCYELCVVEIDGEGRPTGRPHPGFDPRHACLRFSFKAGCPSGLDCLPPPCPPEEWEEPEISYLAKDYSTFRQLILDRLALLVPDWRERHVPDLGVTLVEILAYVGDHLSYYQDAVATEAYLDTARRRISVRRHARLVDYRMHEGCNARAFVHLKTDTDQTLPLEGLAFVTNLREVATDLPRILSDEHIREVPAGAYEWFEPLWPERVRLKKTHNEICFYTWGDMECCLLAGATSATLRDEYTAPGAPAAAPSPRQQGKRQPGPKRERARSLDLREGDVLVFVERVGPHTGDPADADPSRRHAVRLTDATPTEDPLCGQPVVEITWREEDALPFPLCLSWTSDAPECEPLECVSVALGNIVLVDHGRPVLPEETLGPVPCVAIRHPCADDCPDSPRRTAGRFRPRLGRPHLAFHETLDTEASASGLLTQDVRQARPALTARSARTEAGLETGLEWTAVSDLISSNAGDAHLVVEIDDERFAHLRFGDGELGRAPEAEHLFRVCYRVGDGPAGNVARETITHLVTNGTLSGVTIEPCNPMPARGGTAPEPVALVKALAPFQFRERLERAITPADYARLAERKLEARIQRAAARLRWTGSWYEVELAVDPAGLVEADPELLRTVEQRLERYRRIVHDLRARTAVAVPLDLRLTVCAEPHALKGQVKAALLQRLGSRVLADGTRGFFHPDRLTFGEGVRVSRLVAEARTVAGVENVIVAQLKRYGEPDEGALEDGILKLAPFEVPRLDNDPSYPENGVLELEMGGGR